MADTIRKHVCRQRCLARMRGGEVCHRTVGHGNDHSARRTLDNDAARRREWAAA